MSMSYWSTTAYGVTDDDIRFIEMDKLWPIFLNINNTSQAALLDDKLRDFLKCEGVEKIEDLDDEQKETFIVTFYENTTNKCITSANAAVLADLVSQILQIPFDEIVMDKNDDGDEIVGIGAYYPWDTPEKLKNASQYDYEHAFIIAYAMFGINGHYCNIDKQSISNWE